MLTVHIPEHLAKRLQEMAERENRSVDEVVTSLVENHIAPEAMDETPDSAEAADPFDAIDRILDYDITDMSTTVKETMRGEVSALDALMGMFDDEVTDMSMTVKETMHEYYKNKKWKS